MSESRPTVRRGGQRVPGVLAGDRRVRVTRRPEAQTVAVPVLHRRGKPANAALIFTNTFGGLIAAGTLLLALPLSSAHGGWTTPLDALFTATSAVCLTGLVVVDTGTYWSGFGQVVILALFQIGGIGFMTSSTLLLLLIGRQITIRERVLLREALGSGGLGSALTLARKVTLFTLAAECAGAVVLSGYFAGHMEPLRALWWGVFHAVSGFNNAGFDLMGGFRSLTPYQRNPVVLLTIAALMILGALSYTVVEDVLRRRRFARLTLDTKLVLLTTCGLQVLGTVGLLFTERNNQVTLGGMDLGTRLLNAFFHTATRTGGFSAFDVGRMTEDGLMLLAALMFIGGATASTAGGIKVQTFSVLFFAIVSTVRGRRDVEAFRRRVPTAFVMRALSIALLAIAAIFLLFFALQLVENVAFVPLLFETISAFATVGLSMGITPDMGSAGRLFLIVGMFAGRLGPLTLALALAARERRSTYHWPEEAVKLG
jgi:trk system potassium uptake protein TrkH